MKAQILKISGCKTEKEFYSKFPSEEEFMKVHGKTFKKAMLGAKITSAANGNILQGISNRVDPALQGLNYQQGQYSGMPQQLGYQNLLGQQQNLSGNLMNSPSIQQSASFVPSAKIGEGGGNSIGGGGDILGSLGKMINPGEKIAQGIMSYFDERKQAKKAGQWEGVTDLQLQAAMAMPEPIKRRYVRPEDNTMTGEELFPINGTGTNPLGKDGISIRKAGNGFTDVMGAGGTDFANKLVGTAFNNNAGTQVGSSVGDAIGMIPGVGPIVGAVAGPVLGAGLGALDQLVGPAGKIKKANKAIDRNIAGIMGNQFGQGIHKQYNQHMEEGGNINPQIIKQFGNINMNDLRTGGNLRQNTMNGDLQTYDEGYAEPVSYNPYLPDGGETVMFRGPSHEEGGMDITYGRNPVEVEGGEPAVKLEDGGGADNLVVFGNLKIPSFGKAVIGDKDATGKFKNYIANLSKKEEKANKVISSSTGKLEELDMITPFDKLTLASHKANIMGADKQLQEIADKKIKTSILQEAMNMAKNSPTAKYGTSIPKAEKGYNPYLHRLGQKEELPKMEYDLPWIYGNDFRMKGFLPNISSTITPTKTIENTNIEKSNMGDTSRSKNNNEFPVWKDLRSNNTLLSPRGGNSVVSNIPVNNKLAPMYDTTNIDVDTAKEEFPWMQLINSALPYFRPSDAESLDARQLMGESFALSNNQLEPVQAQTYNPQLDVPYDISLQDIRNENQADYRGAQRMMGGNPAAQAILNAQKYAANQKVGGEEFRLNQALKDKVFSGNRATLNDAQLKNLGIYDNQYTRQEQAKANTKAVTQAALNSMSDKYSKNQLENRTLQAYENLYNYRYDGQGRAINMNPLAQFNTTGNTRNISGKLRDDLEYSYDASGNIIGTHPVHKNIKAKEVNNGGIVKAFRNL
jgi:hypothetical protein